jgi:hypothetical protein
MCELMPRIRPKRSWPSDSCQYTSTMSLGTYSFIIFVMVLGLVAYVLVRYGPQLKRLRISLKDGSIDLQLRKPVRFGRELTEDPQRPRSAQPTSQSRPRALLRAW